MVASTTAPAVMPEEDQFDRAKSALEEAVERLLDVSAPIGRIAEFKGAAVPTFEDIGRVFSFVIDARSYLDELTRSVEMTQQALEHLDYVRVTGGQRDDA